MGSTTPDQAILAEVVAEVRGHIWVELFNQMRSIETAKLNKRGYPFRWRNIIMKG